MGSMSGQMRLTEHMPAHTEVLDGLQIAPSWLSGGANFGHPRPVSAGQPGGIALGQPDAARDVLPLGPQDDQGSLPLL